MHVFGCVVFQFVHFIQLKRTHLCIMAVLVSGMAVRGVKNIQEQHNIVGESGSITTQRG